MVRLSFVIAPVFTFGVYGNIIRFFIIRNQLVTPVWTVLGIKNGVSIKVTRGELLIRHFKLLSYQLIFINPRTYITCRVQCFDVGVDKLLLESENPDKDIFFYINSPGGSVTAGMSIYDTMNFIKPNVSTLCLGQAASMGAFLLSAGEKGKRFALPNSRIMIHQPLISGGLGGQASDIEIHARELLKIKEKLNAGYSGINARIVR